MKEPKDIIVFVEHITKSALLSMRKYDPNLKSLLLRDVKRKAEDSKKHLISDFVAYVDFEKPYMLAEALMPYQERLLAITTWGELGVEYLSRVVPHVPYLRTPSAESIQWSLDKYQMRRRLKLGAPQHTPKFTKVRENTKKERMRIIDRIGFPMIIKPANLQESVLVAICYHEEELEKTLRNTFRKLKGEYAKMKRLQLPTIIAEAYMEGDMYSIDSYVNSRGVVYHCPIVKVVTGKNIGHDDFYNYLRITPTGLKKTTIEKAEEVAVKAIHALGLRSTTTHTELIKMDDEWKVIEIGARMGGHRHDLHTMSCDIDHYQNDILVRIPRTPRIPKKCKGFAAVMRHFPSEEGIIENIKGLKIIGNLESVKQLDVKLKVGDMVRFAKNGGKGVFYVTMYNEDRSKLLADIRRIEKIVKVKIKKKGSRDIKK